MLGRIAITAALVLTPLTASAQTAPISRTITLTYAGTVTQSASDTLMIRQPDGSLTRYTGPLPEFPYKVGDQVSISFNATVPTRAFYDTGIYQGQLAADGIYRIEVTSPYYNGGTTPDGIGNSTAADVSGPIGPALNAGQPTNTRMTIVYDYNADTYSILGAGDFSSGANAGPGYFYNAASTQYVGCTGGAACTTYAGADPILFQLRQNADGSMGTGNIGVMSTDLTSGTGTGFFSLLFSGAWNLPTFGGAGGGPTPVPEPGMLGLFAAAFAVLPLRRRLRLGAA